MLGVTVLWLVAVTVAAKVVSVSDAVVGVTLMGLLSAAGRNASVTAA